MTDTIHQFIWGEFTGAVLHEGYVWMKPASIVFKGAPKDERSAAFEKHGISPEKITLPVSVLLLQRDDQVILIDCGSGYNKEGFDLGYLPDSMIAAGLSASDVTHVILTHGHFDHAGGILDEDEQPLFPNAQFFMSRGGHQWWTKDVHQLDPKPESDAYLDYLSKAFSTVDLELFDPDVELLSGIHVIATPGHTANHISLHIVSGDEHLLITSDAIVQPLHIEYPDWYPVWNFDGKQTEASIHKLFALIDEHEPLIFGCHFPFPGLGHIRADGDSRYWEAETQ